MRSANISRRRILRGVGAVGVAGVVGTQATAAQQREPVDRHIVGVLPQHADVARDAAEEVYRVLDFGPIGQAVSGWYTEEALNGLQNNPNVRYIEAEGVMEAIDHTTDEDGGDPTEEQVLPWGIDRIDADLAHHDDETGGGSSVSIIDTGIDPNHETLDVAAGEAFVDCDGDCAEDWDDDHGHGTHCAGTANALDNDIGVVGTSTEAALFAVKVLDDGGGGTFSDVAAGIEWTADQGIDVGSLSLGGGDSETVQDACQYAYGKGTLLVAAAGNDGPRPNSVSYPAAYEECIAVSATDDSDDIARFSSRGDEVELAAPGVDVLSSLPDDEYDHWDGTSMACPHVSGAGAQLMEHGYTNEEARDRLNETAEDIGLDDNEQGNGLVDVAAALDSDKEEESLAVETHDATDVDESSATFRGELTELGGYDEATVYFEWGESGDDLPHTTDEQTLDFTGEFDDEVTDLESDTEYEFRAVAEADDDSDTGDTITFTAESADDDDEETTAPVIDEFDLTDTSNPRWARVEVDWTVSDDGGSLDEVTTEIEDWNDTSTSDVGGDSASGTHEHRERDAHGEVDVTLTVTNTDGTGTSDTKTTTLG